MAGRKTAALIDTHLDDVLLLVNLHWTRGFVNCRTCTRHMPPSSIEVVLGSGSECSGHSDTERVGCRDNGAYELL